MKTQGEMTAMQTLVGSGQSDPAHEQFLIYARELRVLYADRRDLARELASLRHAVASSDRAPTTASLNYRADREAIDALARAIAGDQLVLHYQPQVDCRTGAVEAVEALVRWRHPRRGLLLPDEFIPQAEGAGAIGALTAWVLEAALRQERAWRREGLNLRVAVNLSAQDLRDPGLAGQVAAALATRGIEPGPLELEITETAIIVDEVQAVATLESIHDMGVKIAIDDFGTGHSSLARLRGLPVDAVKIPTALISGVAVDRKAAAIVRGVIDLGHSLGLRVIGEGVEDRPTWETLVELGCDEAQGYYLSRPLPAADLCQWLRSKRANGESTTRSAAARTRCFRELHGSGSGRRRVLQE